MASQKGSDEPRGIGSILNQARRRQELDLETVEEQTKIRTKYLQALEDEEWDVLPAPAYARGFIRAYANLLGLDAEVLVDEYRRRYEDAPTTTYELPEPLLRGHRPDGGGPRRPRWPLLAVGGVIVAVVAALLVIGLTGGGNDEERPAGAEGAKKHGQERKRGGGGGKGSSKQNAAKVPDTATVKLVARSDVQACLVDADGQVLIPNQLLTQGTEDGPYVSKQFRVELNPGAAQIMLNGEEADTPPSPNAIAYKVTPAKAKQIAYTGSLCE